MTFPRPTLARRALAVAALTLACGAASAQSAVQIYGRIGQFATSLKTEGQSDRKELRDHGSRLGFRGTEDMGGGLKGLFGLEMGLNADNGTATDPFYRHSYVGLGDAAWGTLALGRLDSGTVVGSPIYTPVTRIVEFVGYDAGSTAISTNILNSRNRTSNAVGYASPQMAGITVRARGYLRGAGTAAEGESAARSLDLGVEYSAGPLYAALSYGKDERAGGLRANEFDDKWQLGLSYELGDFRPYALWGRDTYENTATSRGGVDYWLLGATWSGGPHKVVLNVMRRDVQAARQGERRRWQAAYTYAFSRRTELQAFVDEDGVDSRRDDVKVRALGLGLRHVF